MATLPEADEFPDGIYQIELTDPVVGGPPNEATGAGLANFQGLQLARRTRWLRNRIEESDLPASVEVTVGQGGQFATLYDALRRLSVLRPRLQEGAQVIRGTVRLLAGFTLAEQIVVRGLNLGWCRIISDSPTVVIDAAGHVPNAGEGARGTFVGLSGAVLPEIAAQFSCINVPAFHAGIVLMGPSSCVVAPNCGIDATGTAGGLQAVAGASASIEGSRFRNSRGNAVRATRGSVIAARGAVLTGAATYGAMAWRGSSVDVDQADLSGAGLNGIRADGVGRINAQGANCRRGSTNSSSDIAVFEGGMISAAGAVGGMNIAANTITANGVIFA